MPTIWQLIVDDIMDAVEDTEKRKDLVLSYGYHMPTLPVNLRNGAQVIGNIFWNWVSPNRINGLYKPYERYTVSILTIYFRILNPSVTKKEGNKPFL